jgi:HK97 family phage portal protein
MKSRDLLLRGNAYSLIRGIPGRRTQFELTRLHPDRVTPKLNEAGTDVVYEYARDDGRRVILPRRQVLHIWHDSDDGLSGISPIQAHRESIGDAMAIRAHGSKFFANAARISGVLEMPAGVQVSKDALKAMLEDFEQMYTGHQNARKTAALPGGVQFKQVGVNMEDAQWIETRKITAREIYGIFGIPPHKAGDLADATFSNVEHQNLEFVIDALTPRLVAWEQAINRDLLLNDPRYYVKFNVAGMLRGDFKTRQEGLQLQRRNGIISADEWRALEDLNPRDDEGGDKYIIEKNMRYDDGTNPVEPEAGSEQGDETATEN